MLTMMHNYLVPFLMVGLVFFLCRKIHVFFHRPLWLNPIVLSILLSFLILKLCNWPYDEFYHYLSWTRIILDVSIIALAIPLYNCAMSVKALWKEMMVVGLIMSILNIVIVTVFAFIFPVPKDFLYSLVTKSVTSPMAVMMQSNVGGFVSLAVAAVIFTGIMGAMIGPVLFKKLHIEDDRVQGFALGVCAHVIGTAKAIEISERCAAFSGVAMVWMGLCTALHLLWVVPLLRFFLS
jgi:putative effector of murein hydrolase